MISEIQNLLESYYEWLRDKTILREVDDWVEITTPYIDRHNDYLQIYAKRHDGGYILSDDGYILQDLFASGCNLDSQKRQSFLRIALNGFGVKQNGDRLEIVTSINDFSRKKHNLMQAMISINDLFYLAEPVIKNLFLEDVIEWLDSNEIRFTPQVKFTGITMFDHHFDFVIPKSKAQPERIIKAINRPDRSSANNLIFAWMDTREARKDVGLSESKAYAILNDSDQQKIQSSVIEALKSYEIGTILWRERQSAVPLLAA